MHGYVNKEYVKAQQLLCKSTAVKDCNKSFTPSGYEIILLSNLATVAPGEARKSETDLFLFKKNF